MVVADLKSSTSTKIYEVGDYSIWLYAKPIIPKETFKIGLGNDYYVVINKGDEDVTKEVSAGLGYCYSNLGYMIVNVVNSEALLNRMVRYLLYERKTN